MAYVKELKADCSHYGCSKQATREVFNNRNGSVGKFCTAHAGQKVRELNRIEAEYSQS